MGDNRLTMIDIDGGYLVWPWLREDSAGGFLLLDRRLRHAVEAETESAFLLTLGGPGVD